MSDKAAFVVTEFTNPSGAIVYRVQGWLNGRRIRKNFAKRAAANAERDAREIERLQGETGIRTTVTRLTEAQLQEAESAFQRLADHPKSLSFYLDYALTHYRAPEREQSLSEAVAQYLEMKGRERDRKIVSATQVNSITKELALLKSHFPDTLVAQLAVPALTAFCDRGNPSLKTYNNRRGILGTFFKFAFQKDWIPANPIEKIPYHRIAHRRGSARTLTVEQAEELMRFVEGFRDGVLVPFFAVCLFAGVRPCVRGGEITKLRPEDVRLDTGVIHIEPEVSKVRMKRNVTIQPNLAAWLRAYPLTKFPLVPSNMQHLRADIAKQFNLTHDVMRHTFISMFVAKYRSMGEAALQAGNSESIIRKHYLDLKSTQEAEAFFSILPKTQAVVPFAPQAAHALEPAMAAISA